MNTPQVNQKIFVPDMSTENPANNVILSTFQPNFDPGTSALYNTNTCSPRTRPPQDSQIKEFSMLFRILALPILALSLGLAGAQEIEPITIDSTNSAQSSPRLDQIWLGTSQSTKALPVDIGVLGTTQYPSGSAVPFECLINSRFPYKKAVVILAIRGTAKKPLLQETLSLEILKGKNTCTFQADTANLPPGQYHATFEVIYQKDETPATFTVPMTHVTDAYFAEKLANATTKLITTQERLDAMTEGSNFSSNFQVRLKIAEDMAHKAQIEFEQGQWQPLSKNIAYLESAANRLSSELDPNVLPSELIGHATPQDLASLNIQDGTYYANGRPIYLFGRAQENPSATDIELLHRYGLNLTTLTIRPQDALIDAESPKNIEGAYDPAFRAAAENNVTIAVQLAPQEPTPWMLEQWPDLADKGFVDPAHIGVHKSFNRLIDSVIPYLTKQKMLNSVSIAYKPQFRFDDENTQNAFIERIRALYHDPQELNRLWHAKLADFNDIEIWSQQEADWFQNRRAYQFDWQTFHMDLTTQYFTTIIDKIRDLAPYLDLQATLADSVFQEGETRLGVDREALLTKLDVNGCTTVSTTQSPFYALNYPRPAAFYTLMRSVAPQKPLFDMQCDIQLDQDAAPAQIYNYVYTVLWESVLNGVSAAALPENSPVFHNPWALEAFATAALDINRLSPLVNAFQQAPPDVAVLFSGAAKVLDDGNPHLESSWFAYEGSSFGGYNVRYATENSINNGLLDNLHTLILPQTPALEDITFENIAAYVNKDNVIARVGTPIPYNERGQSRKDVIRHTGNTILVRGINLPTEYLHAMDAAVVLGGLPDKTRPISQHGYPIEGLKSRVITRDGAEYLYLVNLRKEPILVNLTAGQRTGRDLLRGRDISFPSTLDPLDPILVRLDKTQATDGPDKVRRRENIITKYLKKAANKIF